MRRIKLGLMNARLPFSPKCNLMAVNPLGATAPLNIILSMLNVYTKKRAPPKTAIAEPPIDPARTTNRFAAAATTRPASAARLTPKCIRRRPSRARAHPVEARDSRLLHRPAETRRLRSREQAETERAGGGDTGGEARRARGDERREVGRRAAVVVAEIVVPLRLDGDARAHELEERRLREGAAQVGVEIGGERAPRLRGFVGKPRPPGCAACAGRAPRRRSGAGSRRRADPRGAARSGFELGARGRRRGRRRFLGLEARSPRPPGTADVAVSPASAKAHLPRRRGSAGGERGRDREGRELRASGSAGHAAGMLPRSRALLASPPRHPSQRARAIRTSASSTSARETSRCVTKRSRSGREPSGFASTPSRERRVETSAALRPVKVRCRRG